MIEDRRRRPEVNLGAPIREIRTQFSTRTPAQTT